MALMANVGERSREAKRASQASAHAIRQERLQSVFGLPNITSQSFRF